MFHPPNGPLKTGEHCSSQTHQLPANLRPIHPCSNLAKNQPTQLTYQSPPCLWCLAPSPLHPLSGWGETTDANTSDFRMIPLPHNFVFQLSVENVKRFSLVNSTIAYLPSEGEGWCL